MNGLLAEVVEDHIRTHLVDPAKHRDALNVDAADQLVDIVHSYFNLFSSVGPTEFGPPVDLARV